MSIRLFGSNEPLPRQHLLQAGPISLIYEQGALRRIRYGQREVIRNIYFALRDQNWGTIPFRLLQTAYEVNEHSFQTNFEAIHYLGAQDVFRWQATVSGQENGEIDFSLSGEALETVWRNRAGFCVLHPIAECAGQPVTITEPDGQQTVYSFPKTISPDSPFPTIRAMTWAITDSVTATIRLEGDDFETEDQRNWTDTSFKTYCTPQSLPMPVELRPGSVVEQRIHLSFEGLPPVIDNGHSDTPITIEVGSAQLPMPTLGTLEPFGGELLSENAADFLRPLNLDHYRAEVHLYKSDWAETVAVARKNASLIAAPLLLALTFSDNAPDELAQFLTNQEANPYPIQAILLFQKETYATPTSLIQQVAGLLKKALPDTRIGAGVQTNYAEFGRNIFDANGIDFVAYSIQPQAHAFDLSTIIENMEAQADTVFSAKALYPAQAVYVSPLALLSRFNPYARSLPERWVELPVEQQTDTRQHSYAIAGWVLGSLKNLAEASAASVSLFRAAGPAGLVPDDETPSPILQLLAWLQKLKGGTIRPTKSSNKLAISSLLITQDAHQHWLLANHTAQTIQVQLPTENFDSIQTLGGDSSQPQSSKIDIGPFEILYIH